MARSPRTVHIAVAVASGERTQWSPGRYSSRVSRPPRMLATRVLRLTTFGGLALRSDDRELGAAAGQRRPLAVLAILAAAGAAGVSRDRLLALLWPDAEPERGRRAVNQALYALRRATELDDLVLGTADLRLNTAIVDADTIAFEEALMAGRPADGIALYRGPFLDGVVLPGADEFERWLEDERRRWARRVADVLRDLARTARSAGAIEDELAWCLRLVELDPVDANAVAALVDAHGRAGDPVGARRAVQAHEARVRDELGLGVSRTVLDRLAAVEAQAAARTVPPPPLMPTRTPERVHPRPARIPAPTAHADDPPDAATVPAVDRPTPHATRAGARGGRPVAMLATLVAVAAAGVAALRAVEGDAPAAVPPAPRAGAMAVAPFTLESPAPALAFLREGAAEILARHLADGAGQRVLEPATVIDAAAAASPPGTPGVSTPRARALAIARDLGAGEVVVGRIGGTPARVTLGATVVDVASGADRAGASVSGPLDSLASLVDSLAGRLVAGRTFGPDDGDALRTASLGVLRAFLRGEEAYRDDRYRDAMAHFDAALDRDSTFAPAALALAIAADRFNAAEQQDRALALAWAARDRLGRRDRALLVALLGPRFPDPSPVGETLAAWDRALALAPDRAHAWTAFGERLVTDGALFGLRDPQARAAAAFQRAIAIDSTDARARRRLVELAVRVRDRAALRALATPATLAATGGHAADYLRWRVALAVGDAAALARLRERFPQLTSGSLRAIALASQHDGVALDDGARALHLLSARAVLGPEQLDALLAEHALALARGRPILALDVTEHLKDAQPGSRAHLRLRVLDALYADGDGAAAVLAARALSATADAPARREPAARALQLADACVLAQWRAAPWSPERAIDPAPVRRAIAALRADALPRVAVPVGAAPRACADMVEAMLAVTRGTRDAGALVARLDDRLLSGPALGDASAWATLAVARLYDRLGDPARARRTVAQRPWLNGWPRYRATALRMQAELAMRTGDRAAAADAWRAYFAIHDDPEPSLAPRLASDRARARPLLAAASRRD